jgi:hypothetical protein
MLRHGQALHEASTQRKGYRQGKMIYLLLSSGGPPSAVRKVEHLNGTVCFRCHSDTEGRRVSTRTYGARGVVYVSTARSQTRFETLHMLQCLYTTCM